MKSRLDLVLAGPMQKDLGAGRKVMVTYGVP